MAEEWSPEAVRRLFDRLVSDDVVTAYLRLRDTDGCEEETAATVLGVGPDAVAELCRVGMAQYCPEPSTHERVLVAAPPDLALAGVLAGLQTEVRRTHERLLDGYQRLALPSPAQTPGVRDFANTYIEVISERAEIIRISASLMNAARGDWMSLETLATENPKHIAEVPLPIFKGEVRSRAIYEAGYMNDRHGAEAVRKSMEAGEEARLLPSIPMKLKMVDDRAALVPLTPTGMGGALLIRSYVIVSALREYFELLWERAIPVGSKKPYTGTPLSEVDVQILQLMAQGDQDDQIRKKLNLSTSTIRRHYEAIRNELGARSRFAAGVAAHRRGWVE